jgi:phosphatidylinositol glycan class N
VRHPCIAQKRLLSRCRYDRVLIQVIVIAAYLGWAAYSSLSLFPCTSSVSADRPAVVRITTAATLAIFWALFAAQRAPWTFYVYVTFPCYFWQQFVLRGIPVLVQQFKSSDRLGSFMIKVLFHLAIVVAVLQCMVVRRPLFISRSLIG